MRLALTRGAARAPWRRSQQREPVGVSANGKKLGRPSKKRLADAETSGLDLSTRYASHGGVAPGGGVGGNSMVSKTARREIRQSRTAVANPPPSQRSDAGMARGPQLLPTLLETHPSYCGLLKRVSAARRFGRSDVVGGELLGKTEFLQLKQDPFELDKVGRMAHFITLRERGHQVRRTPGACKPSEHALTLTPACKPSEHALKLTPACGEVACGEVARGEVAPTCSQLLPPPLPAG